MKSALILLISFYQSLRAEKEIEKMEPSKDKTKATTLRSGTRPAIAGILASRVWTPFFRRACALPIALQTKSVWRLPVLIHWIYRPDWIVNNIAPIPRDSIERYAWRLLASFALLCCLLKFFTLRAFDWYAHGFVLKIVRRFYPTWIRRRARDACKVNRINFTKNIL